MYIESRHDLPRRFFCHWDKNGKEFGVLVVKARFHIRPGSFAHLASEQPDFVMIDEFYGDPAASALKYESDLAPHKPRTDVIFNAVARSPEQKDCTNWRVSVQIDNLLTHQVAVFGERHFHSVKSFSGKKWQLSDTKKIHELPLRYEYAYGGTVPVSDNEMDYYPYNPVGTGLLTDHMLHNDFVVRAPQIGLLGELNNLEPGREITVCGYGSLAKGWYPRLPLAGTFDKNWAEQRHPLMPEDYDMAFWNSAAMPLQLSPYLRGGECITVRGFLHDPTPYSFRLAGVGLRCAVRRENSAQLDYHLLNLDTVYCDISDENPEKHEMFLTWRAVLDRPDMISAISVFTNSLDSTDIAQQARYDAEQAQSLTDATMMQDMAKRQAILETAGTSLAELRQSLPETAVAVISSDRDISCHHLVPEKNISLLTDARSGSIVFVGLADYHYPSASVSDMEKADEYVSDLQLDQEVIIYIRLLEENVEVWRPVRALWHGRNLFYVLPQQRPAFEKWAFHPYQRVICKVRETGGKASFFAVDKAL